jgi:dCMP deaminase
MKQKFIDYYMNIAELSANLSYAKRLQVGAVIVKGNQILSSGYNGMPSGWENVCEITIPEHTDAESRTITPEYMISKPEVMHAERNAIDKVAASNESTQGAAIFCTHAPCLECAKSIYNTGITDVYYKEEYRSTHGLDFLKKTGVHVYQYHKHAV